MEAKAIVLFFLARAAVSFNYRRVKKNLSYSEETFRLYEDTFKFARACTGKHILMKIIYSR